MREKPRFLALSEAARELGISPNTLRLMANEGRVACERGAYGWRSFDPAVIATEKKRRGELEALRQENAKLKDAKRARRKVTRLLRQRVS